MQVVDRSQDSIVKSLSELREIERQRIADEAAALQRAEAARVAAREAAELRVREEQEARARAEREAQLAAEQAQLAAEREERRRIDAAAAAELARQQVALEHARMASEHALKREQVARTRPTWMVAVTASALVAAGLLLWVALTSRAAAGDAQDQARLALLDRDQAKEDAREARDGLTAMRREVDDHARLLQKMLDDLRHASTQAEREALTQKAKREQEVAREMEKRRREREAAREREIRLRPIVISEECKRNALAPGCGK